MLHDGLPAHRQTLGELGRSQGAALADEREDGASGRIAERGEDVIRRRTHTRTNWRVMQ